VAGADRERILSDDEVREALAGRAGWSGDHEAITRQVKAPSFLEGIEWVRAVAGVAEAMDHHPDIDIRWRTVRFTLATHTAGGVTALDLEAAGRIDEVLPATG
jgi:4a-hydroxytetrahydrobiopterin dehydratase